MFTYDQYCPVAHALEILGDRWTLLIVRDVLTGTSHFNDLQRGLPGISRALLSSRLRRLQETGVIEKSRTGKGRRTTEYHLTEAGEALQPVYRQQGREVLVALNADVGGMHAGASASAMEGYSTLFAALACESGVRFLDLHPVFASEYVRLGRRLNFEHDPHWNAYTHRLAAGAVARALRTDVSESACRDGS